MPYVLGWLLFGFITAAIGTKKGENGCLSFLIGALLGPFGILIAVMSKGNQRICPYCKELVKPDAIVCKHCGKDIARGAPAKDATSQPAGAATGPVVQPKRHPRRNDLYQCPRCSRYYARTAIVKVGNEWVCHNCAKDS